MADDGQTVALIHASERECSEIIEQLSWLAAVFRNPQPYRGMISEVQIKQGSLNECNINLLQLKEIDSVANMCWHRFAQGSVVASGFQIPGRAVGVGLEVSFNLMCFILDTRTAFCSNGQWSLGGFSAMAILTAYHSTHAVAQWHLVWTESREGVDITAALRQYHQRIGDCVSDSTLLETARTYLG